MPAHSPLEGQKVVVTRPRAQAGGMAARLESLGAEVFEFPTIAIRNAADIKPPIASNTYDWIVLTSANGVRALASLVERENGELSSLASTKFFAVGPATAEELRNHDVEPVLVPADYVAEGGVEALDTAEPSWKGKRVLFACAKGARRVIPDALRGWGAEVESRVVYETVRASVTSERVAALIAAEPHWLTFTSGSTATNFAAIVGATRVETLLETAAVASIGPQTSAACEEAGLPVTIEATRHDTAGLVDAIVDYIAREDH